MEVILNLYRALRFLAVADWQLEWYRESDARFGTMKTAFPG